jgi:CheY-like chemotaxis protein
MAAGQELLSSLASARDQAARQLDEQQARSTQAESRQSELEDEIRALRDEQKEVYGERDRLRGASRQLTGALARLQDELDLLQAERDELVDKEGAAQRLLEERDAGLAAAGGRIRKLENDLDEARAAQLQSVSDRQSLLDERDALKDALEGLEAKQREAAAELERAVSGREELRKVYEALKQAHDAAAERHRAAFQEMSSLQEQVRVLSEQQAQKESEQVELIRTLEMHSQKLQEQLAAATADLEALQGYQIEWALQREEHVKGGRTAAAREAELEGEVEKLRLELSQQKGSTEEKLSDLRLELVARRGQLEEQREQLQSRLREAEKRVGELEEAERGAREQYEELKGLHAHAAEQASKLAAEWSSRRQVISAENQRLTQEVEKQRADLASSQERERSAQSRASSMEGELKKAEGAIARGTLTPTQIHALNTRLNAILGFSEILRDERTNQINPTERNEYLRHVNDSARSLAEDVARLIPPAPHVVPASPKPEPAGAPAAPASNWSNPVVLVADNDPTVKDRIEPFLTRAGYQVVFSTSRAETLKMAIQSQPLAILIDTQLPPDGASPVVIELHRDPRTREIPVVLTARDDKEQLGLKAGQYDFLTKPIDRQQVLQMMVRYDMMADKKRAEKMPSRVLVVDDDPQNLRLVTALLKPLNIEVLSAGGGKAGIEMALKHKPDLIILDLMMPEVDGFEVVTALRKNAETSAIPIVIFTAKNITSEDRERLHGGIQSIMQKGDFRKDQLLDVINKRGERRNRQPDTGAAA